MDAELTYKLFLDGIKKEGISTVLPEKFNRLYNDTRLNVILGKLKGVETVSKRTEDLTQLLITTNGSDMLTGESYPPISTSEPGSNRFVFPRSEEIIHNGVLYPQSLKLLNIGFKIAYEGDPCYSDGLGSKFHPAKFMKTDKYYPIMGNPHRRPTLEKPITRLYFQMYKDEITAIISYKDIDSYAAEMKVEYYRYPVEFIFNPTGPSTDCEFRDEFTREVIDQCILDYIQTVNDPRFESKMVTNNQKQKNN